MSTAQFMKYVLLIAGIGAVIKGVLLILWPAGFMRLVQWWLGLPVTLLRALGAVMIVIGVICIGVAAVHSGNWQITATVILGTVCVLGGFFYQTPATMQRLAPSVLGGVVLARIWGVLALVLAGGVLFIALH